MKIIYNLDEKIEYSKEMITCWVESWGIENVYVAFSGGVDSTVLLNIARELYPEMKAVFNNTGLELPEIVSFVKTFDNVDILYPKMSFHKVIEKYGWPVISKEQSQFLSEIRTTKSEKLLNIRLNGNKYNRGKVSDKWKFLIDAPFKISDRCCYKLKKEPAKKYEKKTERHPILGIMAEESALRKQTYSCNIYDSKRPISKPLLHWSKEDIWNYIRENHIKYCEVYDKGWDRTGCVFCLYGIHKEESPNRLERLYALHPKLYDYVINKLNAKEVLEYIGVKYL